MWILAPITSVIALVFASVIAYRIMKLDPGTEKMKEISEAVHHGAMTFLNKEYKFLVIFAVLVTAAIALTINWETAVCFAVGALFSSLSGNIGMRIATAANARTAQAAKSSITAGLRVAFNSGTVMGMCVVGLGLLGVSMFYYIFGNPDIIYGFGFGASSIALFARVGGGIYTKAADVGADLVGKVEAGIPEDDPRNPAVIADNVGDNVGDVAGMGADLFESYVDSIIAAMAIGAVMAVTLEVVLPLQIAAIGILASVAGTFFVSTSGENLHAALNRGIFASAILMALGTFGLIYFTGNDMGIFGATVAGLIAGVVIGLITEYYTADNRPPAQGVASASETGPATNIIAGISLGMQSTVVPVLAVCAAILIAYYFADLYGIAIAAVGMLSTLGITLATDTYGPVADNAAGIAEMAKMGKDVRERAEALDAVGNTTAAIGKGFAIGSAALTALALFSAYGTKVSQLGGAPFSIDITQPSTVVGLFIGGLLPFVFCSFSISAVGRAAFDMVKEVRRQFKEIPGLMEGTAKPDYSTCVSISTGAALREMRIPGILAVLSPVVVGALLGAEALGGLLAGSVVTGFLLAVFMANSGGAWDNAKKYIERGNLGGKGSAPHKAAVVGDTVGDPFKDTSGPSLNILIKLMSIVALVFAPLFV
ncbi:MAG: sodium-translocating pyrophosphatase [Theionarchaea archaeon]|nr:sodium-translocating pyrophosphatase [Theionarchaea archaeon]MBU6999953.1 sodium-translocating pyrophosphatase [Theionarchaea archaeon]MBU7020143.1 sodium-translocating pyrophosphatase [Theionarchaea archaeon]MBU7035360.1 sodium-translocating pyrophosphatase [Theionarchaea archaeon]MBU7041741.1 sodium-translocating pyrophosphatase [Theionarchaea archaeon]